MENHKNCVHGWSEGQENCPICHENDTFFIQDVFTYNEIYLYISQNDTKNDKSKFQLSKELKERCDRWTKIYNKTKKEYFDKLHKDPSSRYSSNYLYRIYRVSEIFPDLNENSTLKFSLYQKISSSKVPKEEDKIKIKEIVEKKINEGEKVSVRKVDILIKEYLNKPISKHHIDVDFSSLDDLKNKMSELVKEMIFKKGNKVSITIFQKSNNEKKE